MPNEEIDALLGRFIREAGGRLTYLTEDRNGDIEYKGKKYRETAEITDLPAVIISDYPPEYAVFTMISQFAKGFQIVIVKK